MNVNLSTPQFVTDSVSWLDTKNNTIMSGDFTKLSYILPHMTMNGIYLEFPVELTKIEVISDKTQIKFYPQNTSNVAIIKEFSKIETKLLENYILTKQKHINKVLLLSRQLASGFMKVYKENHLLSSKTPDTFCVKISGVWETKYDCGLTYKLFGGTSLPEL
jgi:hypothetical protein